MASQTQIISHWYNSIENFQMPPLDFYAFIERAIKSRQLPDAAISRVDWREGGVLSAKREYLRVKRRRLIFDICGAPFGTGFFVSWWLVETTPSSLGAAITAVIVLITCLVLFVILFGQFLGLILLIIASLLFLGAIGSAASRGAEWADPFLEIPGLGLLIKQLFQPVTYYRIDTAIMFQQAIHASVLEAVDAIIHAHGIRPLTELERKPVMKEFFQR
jgi:hypothetical protein